MLRRLLILAGVALALVGSTPPAHAESGRFNLHLDLAGLVAGPGPNGPIAIGGGAGYFGFDYQIKPPYAIDFQLGAGGGTDGTDALNNTGFFIHAAVGMRFRFLDNREGYLNEKAKGGDAAGNLYLVPRLGFMAVYNGALLGTIDMQFGYEWSVVRPMQLGVFLRPGFGFGTGLIGYVLAGLNFSFELGKAPAPDVDKDGLSDEREFVKYGTNWNNPDTDHDGLRDGDEVFKYHTNPKVADSDGGGSRDGWEVQNGRNPLDPSDDDLDQDKVPDEWDACPGTPLGTEVDQRGCAILRKSMVLDGITFQLNSAEILPSSAKTLERAAQTLRDNPGVKVEIGGHTDDLGKPDYNQRLSEARAGSVVTWLVQHGIEPARIVARGYGNTQPKAPNDSEPNRAKNRRIEFRRLE